jgi:hypothetical protein
MEHTVDVKDGEQPGIHEEGSISMVCHLLISLHNSCSLSYDHHVEGLKTCQAPFDFTGCLVHAKITTNCIGTVLQVRGYLSHNAACINAKIQQIPHLPINPAVYTVVLSQLYHRSDRSERPCGDE